MLSIVGGVELAAGILWTEDAVLVEVAVPVEPGGEDKKAEEVAPVGVGTQRDGETLVGVLHGDHAVVAATGVERLQVVLPIVAGYA